MYVAVQHGESDVNTEFGEDSPKSDCCDAAIAG
jgi:hypothetical protein